MRLVVYIASFVLAVIVIALGLEFGLVQFMPDEYRGYLIETGDGEVTWGYGPFEPAEPAAGFNPPVTKEKPPGTVRIVSLGASGTEGWLTARTVFDKYGQEWATKDISSYSQALQFSLNEIAGPDVPQVEVINLGIAAYNIKDVVRMLKDSLQLNPDMLLIQIGGNETWTAKRSDWSSWLSDDIPYLYTELAYEVLGATQAKWTSLSTGGNAFNPLALFETAAKPIAEEPQGRDLGLEDRLATYAEELESLGRYLRSRNIPVFFLVPSQNIADFEPFGSMAKEGTSPEQLDMLNDMLLEASTLSGAEARQKYADILAIDDGIAEANFQFGRFLVQEGKPEQARKHLWVANNRDLVLKRLPGFFHDESRRFLEENGFPYLDTMSFLEERSDTGVVGYNWLDDDVHLNRAGQFALGQALARRIVDLGLLEEAGYSGQPERLPSLDDYHRFTGYDQEAEGAISFLRAIHNYAAFGRYRNRLRWDPEPQRFVEPILAHLEIANRDAPVQQSLHMAIVLNVLLERDEEAADLIARLNCEESAEAADKTVRTLQFTASTLAGWSVPGLQERLTTILTNSGCQRIER